jgi:hypothetical protein
VNAESEEQGEGSAEEDEGNDTLNFRDLLKAKTLHLNYRHRLSGRTHGTTTQRLAGTARRSDATSDGPVSAEDACWLLSFRDRLYGPATAINIEDLPWSVKVTDWDILQCKAIHPDGHAVVFDGHGEASD